MDTALLFVSTIAIILTSTIVLALTISIPKTIVTPTEDKARSDPCHNYIEYTFLGF